MLLRRYNGVLRARSGNDFLAEQTKQLCGTNSYVTTLHVINSAIVKLGRLTRASTVYRGVAGMSLPDEFWEPNKMNVRGGVEYAFMSTTKDYSVALEYSMTRDGSLPIVFEVEMGMVDRGADLRWLSQYPHEAEILFAPLTGVDVRSVRVVHSSVLLVTVRLSVNMLAMTIEQVIAKMKMSHLQLLDIMIEKQGAQNEVVAALSAAESSASTLAIDTRYVVQDLQALKQQRAEEPAELFNDFMYYETKTKQAFGVVQKVLVHQLHQQAMAHGVPVLEYASVRTIDNQKSPFFTGLEALIGAPSSKLYEELLRAQKKTAKLQGQPLVAHHLSAATRMGPILRR